MNTEATTKAPAETAAQDEPGTTLALPLLHCQSPSPLWRSNVPHLWPGLPRMPEAGYVSLLAYPFSSQEAAICLADLESMGQAALTGVPLQALAANENRPQAAREIGERAALRHFAATGEEVTQPRAEPDNTYLVRAAAQRVLLWAWLLEERQREVRGLSSSFEAEAGHLLDALGVEEDADMAALSAATMRLGDAADILPSWKLVLENASLFLPRRCTLLVNDPRMAEAVSSRCSEAPLLTIATLGEEQCVRWGLQDVPGKVWSQVTLLLWEAMGLAKAPEQRPWLCRTVCMVLPTGRQTREGGRA